MTQQPVSVAVEEQWKEAPKIEVRDAEMIPSTEKWGNEKLQSQPIRWKITRSVTTAEAAQTRWATLEAQIKFPILIPKENDAPQKPAVEEPQIEGLLYENGLLKEEVQSLWKELENWKEACKKQGERKLHTLVEAIDQLEGSTPAKVGDEEERVVCPVSG